MRDNWVTLNETEPDLDVDPVVEASFADRGGYEEWLLYFAEIRNQTESLSNPYRHCILNKASQAIQSPRTVPFFSLVSLLDGYSFPNVLVKGIVAFKH